jgi:serine/threonine protein kinase
MPTKIGKFEIRSRIGKGAFSSVYLAFDADKNKEVALKIPDAAGLSARQVQSLLGEMQAAAQVQNRYLCPIWDVGSTDLGPYLAMPLSRLTLERVLAARRAPFPPREAGVIVRRLAMGIAAAHALGVTHRDLRPANILVSESGRDLMVADLGLALVGEIARAKDSRALAPDYLAPEQVSGQMEAAGPLADVHALGVILYELLTLVRPYRGGSAALVENIRSQIPRVPALVHPGIDSTINAICLKALEKKAVNRFGSAREFASELKVYLEGAGASSTQTMPVINSSSQPSVTSEPKPPPTPPPIDVIDPIYDPEFDSVSIGQDEQRLLDAVTVGDLTEVYSIVNGGANINARCDQGASVLFLACLMGEEKLVEHLLMLGADPNLRAEGEAVSVYAPKPLDLVLQSMEQRDWRRYKPLLELLLQHGATDFRDQTPTPSELRALKQRADGNPPQEQAADDSSWWRFWKR